MNAIFRCDATAQIGFGHMSRCIALAEAMRLSGVASSFAGMFDPAAEQQIAAADFEVIGLPDLVNTDAAERRLAEIAPWASTDFLVLDSYRANEAYLSDLNRMGCPIVVIDDFRSLGEYPCDVVLNFTWEAPSLGYPEGPVLLLGPGYLLVRRKLAELRSQSIERQRQGPVRNLLIAIGGSDPNGIALRLVGLLRERHSGICLRAIAPDDSRVVEAISEFAPGSAALGRQADLSEHFLWADAAITGGGLIKYESAYMGVPAAAIAQNEGQDRETRVLTRAGLVFDLGLADNRSDEELAGALNRFITDSDLRDDLAARMCETFSADPTALAARAIVEAVRR